MAEILESDIPGSNLTIAYTNWERDSAVRKFLVAANDRAEAITTTVDGLQSSGDDYAHPNEAALRVDRVSSQAVGPKRWMVSVEYVRSPFTGFPASAPKALYNLRVAYEAVSVYCTPEVYTNNLPFGSEDRPGMGFVKVVYEGRAESAPPSPWIYNRPVLKLTVPYQSSTEPLQLNLTEAVGKVNDNEVTIGVGGSAKKFKPGELRYDGSEIQASRASSTVGSLSYITYAGHHQFTGTSGGFWTQAVKFEAVDEDSHKEWQAYNVQTHDHIRFPSAIG